MNREELDAMSEFGQNERFIVPFLKFNGEKGDFTLLIRDEKNEITDVKELGAETKVIFLTRGRFQLFSGDATSNEGVPTQKESFSIFSKEGKLVDRGGWRDLKEKHNLKTRQRPYVLVVGATPQEDVVAKFSVLPSSLTNYWEYLKDFDKEGRAYEFIATLSGEATKSKQGKVYYKLVFVKGERVELERVQDHIKLVSDAQKRMDEARASRQDDREVPTPPEDGLPTIEEGEEVAGTNTVDGEEADEIDVKNIPF